VRVACPEAETSCRRTFTLVHIAISENETIVQLTGYTLCEKYQTCKNRSGHGNAHYSEFKISVTQLREIWRGVLCFFEKDETLTENALSTNSLQYRTNNDGYISCTALDGTAKSECCENDDNIDDASKEKTGSKKSTLMLRSVSTSSHACLLLIWIQRTHDEKSSRKLGIMHQRATTAQPACNCRDTLPILKRKNRISSDKFRGHEKVITIFSNKSTNCASSFEKSVYW